MDAALPPPDARPASAVSTGVGLAGLAMLALWVAVCRNWAWLGAALGLPGPRRPMDGPMAAVASLLLVALVMALWSVCIDKVHRRATTGIDWHNPKPLHAIRGMSAVKLVGLWGTWAAIAMFYCLGRWYWQGTWLFAIHVIAAALVPMVVLSIPYVLWLDRVLVQPRDGAWHCGAWLLGREGVDRAAVWRHARAWAVKGFFTAFMLSIVPGGFAAVVTFDSAQAGDPVACVNALVDTLFLVDVQIGTVGYLLTVRPLDAHIRSANPYLAGWVAALMCYPPFVLMGDGGPLDYHAGAAEWSDILGGHPALLWGWGLALAALTVAYAWATVAFGIRFSNLTYRGVVTHGPYALTRHPAYLAKNLFWWGASLPFLPATHSAVDAVRNTAILAAVSGVYWWRAQTEERHLLAEDATYRAYHAWAGAHAPITRVLGRVERWLGWR